MLIANETLLQMYLYCMVMVVDETSSLYRIQIGLAMIGIILLAVLINLVRFIFNSSKGVYNRCKKRNETVVIADEITGNSIELEVSSRK
jgi:hypothetical protein